MLLLCFTPEQRDLESVQPIRLCRHLLHRLLAPGPETRAFLLLYPARRQIRDCQQLHKEQRQPDLFIYTLSNFDKNESTRQIMLTSLTQASRLCPTRALNSNHLLIPRIHHHYRVVWLSISFLPPPSPKRRMREATSLAGSGYQPTALLANTHQGQECQQRPHSGTRLQRCSSGVGHRPKAVVTIIHFNHIP